MTSRYPFRVATIAAALIFFLTTSHKSEAAKDVVDLVGGPSLNDAQSRLSQMVNTNLKDFLDRLDATANALLDRGTANASLLEVQAANSIMNIVSSVRSQFANEMDRQVANVSELAKPFLGQLQRLQESIDNFGKMAVGLEDLIALDILNLPLANRSLYIRRIYGGVFVEDRPNTFYVDLFGLNFGGGEQGTTGEKVSFDVSLHGRKLPLSRLIPPYDAVFEVPADQIKELTGLFDATKIKNLKLDVSVTRETSHWWSIFGWFTEVQKIRLPYSVSLLPKKVGTLTVLTQFPDFEWQPGEEVGPQITVLRDEGPLGPYSAPSPVTKDKPENGNTKIDPKSVLVACVPDMQEARRFKNGRVLPATHSIFQTGFKSASSCGSKGVRDASIDAINKNQFQPLFGLILKQDCQEGGYGWLTVKELLDGSDSLQSDVSGCAGMAFDPDIQFKPNNYQFTVRTTGKPIDPAVKFFDADTKVVTNAKWKVTYRLLSYAPQEKLARDPETIMTVFESETTEFAVMEHLGSSSTTVTFAPSFGARDTNAVGLSVGNLRPLGAGDKIAGRTLYRYKFQYPDLNLNLVRGQPTY